MKSLDQPHYKHRVGSLVVMNVSPNLNEVSTFEVRRLGNFRNTYEKP